MASGSQRRVVLGTVAGPYGMRGWVRIQSSTDPPENILRYVPWQICLDGTWSSVGVAEGRAQGRGVVARFDGCHDRDEALRFRGCEVALDRARLPDPHDGEFYWTDLIGSRVLTVDGVVLGEVERMLETGANDVMVVRGEFERLIPFLPRTVVRKVDVQRAAIVVDWHPDD